MSNFISSDLCTSLKLDKIPANITVSGLNQTCSSITYKCKVNIQSLHNAFTDDIMCYLLPEITGNLPCSKVRMGDLKIPPNIKLADPGFCKPGKIDILLGAELFWKLLCVGQINLGPSKPILQKTRLGWIVSGQVGGQCKQVTCNLSIDQKLNNQLTRFWEIEEYPTEKPMTNEELACEEHFVANTQRAADGRFIVSIPLKDSARNLGESKEQAQRRFFSLERKLQKNSDLKQKYIQFMTDYEKMEHMTQADSTNEDMVTYYMPHHGVYRESSSTTKLRVVFDASARTSTGISLNDLEMVGPTVQDDLFAIILRFRKHAYVLSADIEKMYRMVLVREDQRPLQQILWRASPSEPLRTYSLNTVTYGHAAAAFLAIRCLMQLAYECQENLPEISKTIRHDFYVDDLLTGTDSIEQASYIYKTISSVLLRGGFKLRKWISNEPQILEAINGSNSDHNVLEFESERETKTLGLKWACDADVLMYDTSGESRDVKSTKRTVLSQISQIFDPLGLLSPYTIIAKILIQKLWLHKLDWDESLPVNAHTSWLKFRSELSNLHDLKIPRHMLCKNPKNIELHAFSDAAEGAYGACVYLRSTNKAGEVFVNLLCAKTKVAPLKTLTTPRLELCGALVSARLADKVIKSMDIKFERCVFWTDSTIVLGWVRALPNTLKPFISNRVAEIQNLTGRYEWRHVPSGDNPADLLSRGAYPTHIKTCYLWWHGPQWLQENDADWPQPAHIESENLPETKTSRQTFIVVQYKNLFPFNNFLNLHRLKRVTAYIIRFKNNSLKPKNERKVGSLSLEEINYAFDCLIKASQKESFPEEYHSLCSNQNVSSKSRTLSLNPFMDENQIIRVGGRLRNSDYDFNKKHPTLLDSKHHLTKLIFKNEHLRLLHAGPQLLLSTIRERFWPILGRNLAKATFRGCLTCFRYRSTQVKPIMGDLPNSRLISGIPFHVTGVDYAGPLLIKDKKGRGARSSKCYVSLFVCFATKAVHIELVSDLSTESFILALRRFVSRRGRPAHIYSDNGKNFIGAARELKELREFILSNRNALTDAYAREEIHWHFIPVNAPHMGGLWESGIRIAKYHLKRVVGNALLTYEELYSLLVQIEGIMNSRPLSPLSSDPTDLTPLTPAHLLIGTPITSIPDPDVRNIPASNLSRFQHIQLLKQHFWERWHKEFISEMQQRTKWKQNSGELELNTLVLIKEDHVPPLRWRLGRIVQLHPGKDGISRVATVKTTDGLVKRAFSKLCPLPSEDSTQPVD